MAGVIQQPRNGCTLHGAVSTIEEINGAVPIVHSNAGCSIQNHLARKVSGLGQSLAGGFSVPGTGVQERHVIFGGASRLREQIKNAVKVVDGSLYVVLNSCESAMVGDDIDAMTKEAFEQGEPVLDSILAGFHGDNHVGYSQVLTDIFQKLPAIYKPDGQKDPRLVNILGILPQHDLFYKGELTELKRILTGLGVKANVFFGGVNGVQELKAAPNAALTLVFSKWGIAPAEKLQQLHEIPFEVFETVPVGIEAVQSFAERVAQRLSIAPEEYEAFLQAEAQEFHYYLERLEEEFYEEHLNRRIAIVGDERVVRQIAGFLNTYLNTRIESVVITDFYPDEDHTIDRKKNELEGYAEELYFAQDTREIRQILKHADIDLILGSALEQKAANEKNVMNLQVSYPAYHKTILNKSYSGISGGLTLIEDFASAIKESRKLKEQEYAAYLQA